MADERVDQHKLRRLYSMSITCVYDTELLDDVVSRMCSILGKMRSTVGSAELCKILKEAKTDSAKMIAIDIAMHKAHTSGFYAQHLVKGKDKVEIMNFLAGVAGVNIDAYKLLIARLESTALSTVPNHALYGTIDLTGFEELNKTAIRDTRGRFNAMGIKEYSFTGKTLLDIGCNVGHMLFESTTCGFPQAWGLEHSPHIVTVGNEIAQYLKVSDQIKLLHVDVNNLTVDRLKELTGKTSFDIVFCFAIDGYISVPDVLYRLLASITEDTLYFEPNNHKIKWTADLIKSWGFKSVEKVSVPYDKETGSMRDCFICHK